MKLSVIMILICSCSFINYADSSNAKNSSEKIYASVSSKCDFGRIRDGTPCFSKSDHMQYADVHKPYAGKRVSFCEEVTSDESLEFTVKKAGIVVLMTSPKDKVKTAKKLQSEGWVVVDGTHRRR